MKNIVSKEIAEDLKKVGYDKLTEFYWIHSGSFWGEGDTWGVYPANYYFKYTQFEAKDIGIPAPSIGEMSDYLPESLTNDEEFFVLEMYKYAGEWCIEYNHHINEELTLIGTQDKSLANSFGLMIVRLLDDEFIKSL